MTNYNQLGRTALLKVQEVRRSLRLSSQQPISGIEAALKLNLQVRLENLPTVEGLYYKVNSQSLIVLGNQRPIGRQSFNCAHEIGHHVFGHGTKIDSKEGYRQSTDTEEILVNMFASYLLMPQLVVLGAFKTRGIQLDEATPKDVFGVANYLEVGYSTLANHLHYGLKAISEKKKMELLESTPKAIRESVVRVDNGGALLIADRHWTDRPIDIRTGDFISVPSGTYFEGIGLELVHEGEEGFIFQGIKQSIGRLIHLDTEWSQFVRVSESLYAGLANYRHFERVDDETNT